MNEREKNFVILEDILHTTTYNQKRKFKNWQKRGVLEKQSCILPQILVVFGLPKCKFWSDQKTDKSLCLELYTEQTEMYDDRVTCFK